MVSFKCMRCGICCSHLMNIYPNYSFGLYLSPKEIKWFPEDSVFPLFRCENQIIAYQVGVNICPNLFFKDSFSFCKIYENRPVSCKSFPLSDFNKIEFGMCKFTKLNKERAWDLNSFKNEYEGLQQQIDEAEILPQATEMYILNLKTWIKNK